MRQEFLLRGGQGVKQELGLRGESGLKIGNFFVLAVQAITQLLGELPDVLTAATPRRRIPECAVCERDRHRSGWRAARFAAPGCQDDEKKEATRRPGHWISPAARREPASSRLDRHPGWG